MYDCSKNSKFRKRFLNVVVKVCCLCFDNPNGVYDFVSIVIDGLGDTYGLQRRLVNSRLASNYLFVA